MPEVWEQEGHLRAGPCVRGHIEEELKRVDVDSQHTEAARNTAGSTTTAKDTTATARKFTVARLLACRGYQLGELGMDLALCARPQISDNLLQPHPEGERRDDVFPSCRREGAQAQPHQHGRTTRSLGGDVQDGRPDHHRG